MKEVVILLMTFVAGIAVAYAARRVRKSKRVGDDMNYLVDSVSEEDINAFLYFDDSSVRAEFKKELESEITSVIAGLARVGRALRSFEQNVPGTDRTMNVLKFLFMAYNSVAGSARLLLGGSPAPAGHQMRQFGESFAMALLCSDSQLNVAEEYDAGRFATQRAVDKLNQRDVRRRLGLDETGTGKLRELTKFFNDTSHASVIVEALLVRTKDFNGLKLVCEYDPHKKKIYQTLLGMQQSAADMLAHTIEELIKRLSVVRIGSFNPYEARFPGRRVISREALHIAKYLRAGGYQVVIGDDDGSEVNFTTEKGFLDVVSHPLTLTLLSIPLNIITTRLTQYLSDRRRTRGDHSATTIVIESADDGTELKYSHDGSPIEPAKLKAMLEAMNERQESYHRAIATDPPDAARPIPLFLEHTSRIVGWCHVSVDPNGLKIDDAVVTDDDTWRKVKDGTLPGYSIGGLVRAATCSICGESYFDCLHISSEEYEGEKCKVTISDIDLADISIVTDPVNEFTQIRLVEDEE